jgi:hypothetical protein
MRPTRRATKVVVGFGLPRRCRRGSLRRKIVPLFAIFHKSLCERSLWPKWLRPAGKVVVYSSPGGTLGEVLDRAPDRRTMPCIVVGSLPTHGFGVQIDAEVSKHDFNLRRRYRVSGRRRPVLIDFVESAAALFHNSMTVCLA